MLFNIVTILSELIVESSDKLTLPIPKAEEVKPKAIKVKTKGKKWLLSGLTLRLQQIDELS